MVKFNNIYNSPQYENISVFSRSTSRKNNFTKKPAVLRKSQAQEISVQEKEEIQTFLQQ